MLRERCCSGRAKPDSPSPTELDKQKQQKDDAGYLEHSRQNPAEFRNLAVAAEQQRQNPLNQQGQRDEIGDDQNAHRLTRLAHHEGKPGDERQPRGRQLQGQNVQKPQRNASEIVVPFHK